MDWQKTVNGNDNGSFSWLNKASQEEQTLLTPHIPMATWLIDKHCQKWWKNQPQSWDYQYAHFGICVKLAYPRPSRNETLEFVALYLDCNPILLINDPSEELKHVPVLILPDNQI